MAKEFDFKLNLRGLNELMKSAEMQSALDEAGAAVANAAGSDYGYRTHLASFVAITNVYPESASAAKDNLTNNTLEKALRSVGLRVR
jgi:hypothetical protein